MCLEVCLSEREDFQRSSPKIHPETEEQRPEEQKQTTLLKATINRPFIQM